MSSTLLGLVRFAEGLICVHLPTTCPHLSSHHCTGQNGTEQLKCHHAGSPTYYISSLTPPPHCAAPCCAFVWGPCPTVWCAQGRHRPCTPAPAAVAGALPQPLRSCRGQGRVSIGIPVATWPGVPRTWPPVPGARARAPIPRHAPAEVAGDGEVSRAKVRGVCAVLCWLCPLRDPSFVCGSCCVGPRQGSTKSDTLIVAFTGTQVNNV